MLLEIAILLVLTLTNGLLALSELAVVSARPARLRALEQQGVPGSAVALALAETPGRFLSTVQIGITLVGVISGAFSGATLGLRLGNGLAEMGLPEGAAQALGFGGVVMLVTYASLILGELVPKQVALRDPERVACRVAPAMRLLSKVAAPLVWLLDHSGRLVLRLLGQRPGEGETMTEEEVRIVIAEAEGAGVIHEEERDMIDGVMRLADRSARALMTPRRDVELIDLSDPEEAILARVRATRRTRLPVQDGEADAIVGVLTARDVLAALQDGGRCDVRALVQPAPVVSDTARALDVIATLRAATVHMALVFDEYGHFEGVITAGDILEAITGAFRDPGDDEVALVERADGSFIVAGWMPVDEFAARTGMPVERDAGYETVAGLVLHEMNRLPQVGESFRKGVWHVEVVDLDGRRIDRVIVSRAAAA